MSAVTVVPDASTARARGAQLEPLWESAPRASREVRGLGMPVELERRYGGQLIVPLRPDRPTIIANFVTTLDGIVALGGGDLSGGGLISGFHEPDRFVMGLLRALADVVVVGAGTVRGSSDHRWTPDYIHPASAAAFAAWRASMDLVERPTTVIVSGSGDLPLAHAGLNDPAVPVVIATTPAGSARLRGAPLGEHVAVESIGSGSRLTGEDVMALAACLGARLILTEGGPHLLGEIVRSDLLDELFITVSPQFVGRDGVGRLGLVEGLALAPPDSRWHELASARRSSNHLFLRYRRRDARPHLES